MTKYYSHGRIPTLKEALTEHLNADYLRKLVKYTKEKVPTRKADMAAVIMRYLDGDGLKAVWETLDELQRAAVAEVVHSNSTYFMSGRFRAKYGRDPDWGKAEKYSYRPNPSRLCFFFYKGIMPDDLKERLKAFVPKPRPAKVETVPELPAVCTFSYSEWDRKSRTKKERTEEVPIVVHRTELVAQRELLSVLRLIDTGKVKVSAKTHRPSAATLKTMTTVLEGDDYYPVLPVKSEWYDENAGPIRAFAWPLIVQAGKLAQLSGSKLQLTEAGRRALSEPPGETLRKLWSEWLDTSLLDELSRIECVKGQTGRAKYALTDPSWRRYPIADALAECPAGSWISIDAFSRFMKASGNDFVVGEDLWGLYVSDRENGSLGYANGAEVLDERYLLAFLLEYAATMGVIDVALIPPAGARDNYGDIWGTEDLPYFSRYDGLMYLRITPLGAYCLGVENKYEPPVMETKPVLQVLPNLEVTAIGGELTQGDRIALDIYAVQVSDLVWRLEQSKLLAAVEQGRPIDEIREFFTTHSSNPLPDTVTRLLDDVADRSTKVHDLGPARLVECADSALAALIANDSRTRKHCMLAGTRHLVVPSSSEAAFRRGLRQVGYLVALGNIEAAKSRNKAARRKSKSSSDGE